jgi:DUF1365 family protein
MKTEEDTFRKLKQTPYTELRDLVNKKYNVTISIDAFADLVRTMKLIQEHNWNIFEFFQKELIEHLEDEIRDNITKSKCKQLEMNEIKNL